MRRSLSILCVSGLAIGLAGNVQAQVLPGPTADIKVNGVTLDISNLFVQVGKLYVIPTQVVTVAGIDVTIGSVGNPDPSITYSFAATNPLSGPIPFGFDEAIPLTMPCPAGSTILTTIGYSLTDDLSGNGVTLTPLSGLAQHATGNGTDLGYNVGPAETGSGKGGLHTYVFGDPTPGFQTSGPSPFAFNVLDVHLGFTLTGGGDSVGITGAVGCEAVPEPNVVTMFAGLGVFGIFTLRRRRRA